VDFLNQQGAHFGGILDQVFVFYHFKRREPAGHREIVSAESGRVNNAAIHSRKSFLVNVPPGHDRAAWHIAATQSFRERDNVWFQIPMLESEHLSSAPKTGLDFIGNQKCSVFTTKFLCTNKEIGLRSLTPFPLNGLDHESRHIARSQLSIQLVDIIERDARVESFHQRTESFGKTFAAHQ